MSIAPSDPPRRVDASVQPPLAYTDEGVGPPVVCIHGLPGSARDYRHLAPRLADRRVLRVDLPGFGETPRGRRKVWRPMDRAARLRAWLEALDLTDVVVVGHSMGGPTAVATAHVAADRVRAVALLASPGLGPHRAWHSSGVHPFSRLLVWPGMPALWRPFLKRAFVANGFPSSVTGDEAVHSMIDAGQVGFPEHAARVRDLDLPTLVAFADDDKLVEPEIGEALAEAAPDGPRLRWSTGGHNIQKTRADELADAIRGLHG